MGLYKVLSPPSLPREAIIAFKRSACVPACLWPSSHFNKSTLATSFLIFKKGVASGYLKVFLLALTMRLL